MTIITKPDVGSICITHRGNGGIIERLENERVIIRIPDGTLKSIPLTAIASYELPSVPISPDCITETLPKSIAIGATVGKRHNLGWLGWVQSDPINGRCEVLWQYDRHPTLEKLTDLKIKEIK
jgi:hypothetical protein